MFTRDHRGDNDYNYTVKQFVPADFQDCNKS